MPSPDHVSSLERGRPSCDIVGQLMVSGLPAASCNDGSGSPCRGAMYSLIRLVILRKWATWKTIRWSLD